MYRIDNMVLLLHSITDLSGRQLSREAAIPRTDMTEIYGCQILNSAKTKKHTCFSNLQYSPHT